MKPSFQRAHARWPCDIEVQLFLGKSQGRLIGRGLLIDISVSGAFLRCTEELTLGPFYCLRFGSDASEFTFRVAREGPRGDIKKKEMRDYGLNFELTPRTERRLRLLIDRLPRENTLEDDRRNSSTRGYWS